MSETQTQEYDPKASVAGRGSSFPNLTPLKNLSLFALGTGIFLGLVFLLPVFSLLVWVAAAPILLTIRFRENRRNFLAGFLIGVPWFLISCYWMSSVTIVGL
ncbi:MAG: hypothetical protein KC931_21460, partial [Candidatus Omnitrophica bacterium]|nr:hypothetical protein [Candidatus Omnitrophota bacterium]